MSVKTGVYYSLDQTGENWIAPGRSSLPALSAPATSRVTPPRGQYLPNNRAYVGLLPGWTPAMLTPVYPKTSGGAYNPNGFINITSPGPYVNMIFWGQVRIAAQGATFINCAFAGNEPSWLPGSVYGAIQSYGTSGRQWLAQDCLINEGLWMRSDVPSIPHAPFDFATFQINKRRSTGVHGGRGHLLRSEIVQSQDGWNNAASVTVVGDPIFEDAFTRIEDSWIHGGMYYRDVSVMPTLHEGTHCDAFQTGIGRNYHLIGTYFGGRRDPVGYGPYFNSANIDPSDPGYGSYGYNSGDDYWNSCLMIKQEVDTTYKNLVTNLKVEQCFFEGGTYCINVATTPGLLDTSAGESYFKDLMFVRRPDSRYIIRRLEYADLFTNARVIDLSATDPRGFTIGELAPITRG